MSAQLSCHSWSDWVCLVYDGVCIRIGTELGDTDGPVIHACADRTASHRPGEDITDPDVDYAVRTMVRMWVNRSLTDSSAAALWEVIRPYLAARYMPYEMRECFGNGIEVQP